MAGLWFSGPQVFDPAPQLLVIFSCLNNLTPHVWMFTIQLCCWCAVSRLRNAGNLAILEDEILNLGWSNSDMNSITLFIHMFLENPCYIQSHASISIYFPYFISSCFLHLPIFPYFPYDFHTASPFNHQDSYILNGLREHLHRKPLKIWWQKQ